MEDPFLVGVQHHVSDPLFGAQSGSTKPVNVKGIQSSRDRQIVCIVSNFGENSNAFGSGFLIHEIHSGVAQFEISEWVLTAAHVCTTFDDGIQKCLKCDVRIFGNGKDDDIRENVGNPHSVETVLNNLQIPDKVLLTQPNLCFEVPQLFDITSFIRMRLRNLWIFPFFGSGFDFKRLSKKSDAF